MPLISSSLIMSAPASTSFLHTSASRSMGIRVVS